jgi:hypothetical protein
VSRPDILILYNLDVQDRASGHLSCLSTSGCVERLSGKSLCGSDRTFFGGATAFLEIPDPSILRTPNF